MGRSRYTPFPDLRPLRASSVNHRAAQSSWTLPAVDILLEDLILAWAVVLRAYTGDEDPVFGIDHGAIRVIVSDGTVVPVDVDDNVSKDGCKTGVFVEEEECLDFPLHLRFTAAQGVWLLVNSGATPAKLLPQIGQTLTIALAWRSCTSDQVLRWHEEQGLSLSVVNPNPRRIEGPTLLHHFLQKHASQSIYAIDYLGSDGKRLRFSYRTIDCLSDILASDIKAALSRNARTQDDTSQVIPILIPQSPALYIAICASLKAGAAFCPLDPDAPEERIKFIIDDLGAELVLTDDIFTGRFTWGGGPKVVVVDTELIQRRQGLRADYRETLIDSNHLAYLMYTSGSTGTPKGVGISHFAVTQSLLAHDRHVPQFKRFLQFAAPTFDVFVFELFFPFYRGSTVISCNRRDLLNDLPHIMRRMEVDAAVLTPTVVGGLVRERTNVPRLRVLMTIGEMLTRPVIDEFGDSSDQPGILHAMYGPTEAAIHCTVAGRLCAGSKVGIIGRPLDSVSAFILAPGSQHAPTDADLEILPVGHVGELAIGGNQLSSGYLNRVQLTREVFIESRQHGRVYRTGDKARLLPDGTLECMGRLTKDQVKVRGQRFELGEVEQLVCNIPGINRAIASVHEGILIIFCVCEISISIEDILHACRSWLPESLVPGDVVLLRELPCLPSGKADRRKLESDYEKIKLQSRGEGMGANATANGKAQHIDWSSEERAVRAIFSFLSGVQETQINQKTTIFHLGMDSVSAVRVASALRKDGWNVSAVDVLRHTSVNQLASVLRRSGSGNQPRLPDFNFSTFQERHYSLTVSVLRLSESQLQSIRPCTSVQAGMLASFLNSDGHMYVSHILMRLDNDTNLEQLHDAWETVATKYAMLRTGFTSVPDQQYPFVMIEYKPRAKKIQWSDSGSSLSPWNAIEEQKQLARLTILEQLHEPAWQLSITSSGSGIFLQMSALHAIFDGQSLQMIINDVARVYNGQLLSPAMSVESVLGVILAFEGQDLETKKQFWQSPGSSIVSSRFPDLNSQRPRTDKIMVREMACSWSLSQLEKKCSIEGVTLSAAGQGAWVRVLSEYLGQDTVSFGLVLSARTLLEAAEPLAFPCVTTLPLSCQLQSTNKELLQNIMRLNSDIRKHQFTPLQQLQQWTGQGQGVTFDTIFAYQKLADEVATHAPWRIIDEFIAVDYAVSVELKSIKKDQLAFQLTFGEQILPSTQAELLLQQLDFALIQTLSSPESSCMDFSTFEPRLLSITRAKEPEIQSESQLLHSFVEANASSKPHRVAFEFASSIETHSVVKQQWTYSEINDAGNRIADLIVRNGLQPGDLVAICFEKCPEASFAILGILKAGCAYVALDPDSPIARKSFIVEDSQAQLLLTSKSRIAELEDNMHIPIIALDREGVLEGTSVLTPKLRRTVQPYDVCYCLYTSGTTGIPKGCDISHENAVQAMLAFQRIFAGRWTSDSRWLQFASYHFDVSVLEHFWSWSVGICVTSAPRDIILEDISRTIRQLHITHLDLTPSLARTLHPSKVPSLCTGVFITGGELLKQEILDVWGPELCIYNAYGPTEASIGVSIYPRMPATSKPSNIGWQFDNVGTFILRPGTNIPVIRGAVGELCVSGKLVGLGYRNRPELTKHRFHYLESFEQRVYRTGDLVRVLHDGSFDFLGRTDDQIKLRGQRLEISEINEVMKSSVREVSEVVTLVLKHPRQQKEQLVSFVVLVCEPRPALPVMIDWRPEIRIVISAIQNACRAKLPGYGVPTHVLPITSIPLSANNKLDLARLKDVYHTLDIDELQRLSRLPPNVETAWSIGEREVAALLAHYLNIETHHITKESNLLELGLDSISVSGFVRHLKSGGYSNARPSLIMKNDSVSRLAKALQDSPAAVSPLASSQLVASRKLSVFLQKHSFTVCHTLGISLDSVEGIAPCTPLQAGIIAASLKSKNGLYLNAFYLELFPGIDLERLENAWRRLYARCQILRTSYCATVDGFAQVFQKAPVLPWSKVVVSAEGDIEATKSNRYHQWRQQNLQAISKPLEIILVQAVSTTLMCLHIFHALYDGNSFRLMLQRLSQEYMDQKNIDYGALFQDILPLGPLCEPIDAEKYWLRQMRGAPFHRLPSLTRRGLTGDSESTLEIDDLKGFELVRRKLNITHQALLQTCWMHMLRRFFNNKVTTGVVISGRSNDIEGAEKVIGPLFNVVPFYLEFEPSDTWKSVSRKCHDFGVTSLPYQHVPLRDITRWCKRSLEQPLFDTLFVFDRELEEAPNEHSKMWTMVETRSQADYPLNFEAQLQLDGRLVLKIVAQRAVSDEQTSAALLEEFSFILRQLVEQPDSLCSSSTHRKREISELHSESSLGTANAVTEMNGLQSKFEWTGKAHLIQKEIARLACIEKHMISEHSSIIQLGLDSIDAVKLSSRLKRQGLALGTSIIMRRLTIAGMIDYLSEEPSTRNRSRSHMSIEEYERLLHDHLHNGSAGLGDIVEILPSTPIQEAMITDMVRLQQTTYLNYEILRIVASVSIKRMMSAWENVILSTPILRTSFMEIDDPNIRIVYAQLVHRPKKVSWKLIQLSDHEDMHDAAQNIMARDLKSLFQRPPFDFFILRQKEASFLLISMAHMLYDGWSLRLLHQDVQRAYYGSYSTRPSYRPVLERILSQSLDPEAAEFWKSQLAGVKDSMFGRQQLTSGQAQAQIYKEYESLLTAKSVLEFCKSEDITLQALGHTCWSFVLGYHLQSLDVVFGAVLSGRESEEASEVLFPTMNTVAIRSMIQGTRREMIRYMFEIGVQIAQFQHFPLRIAQGFARNQGRELFDTLFIVQKGPQTVLDGGEALYEVVHGGSRTNYALCVEMEIVNDNIVWRATSETSTVKCHGLEMILQQLDFVAQSIVSDPDAPSINMTGHGTSICGLPFFRPPTDIIPETLNSPSYREELQLETEWSELEKAIRKVLSLVSKVPESHIQKDQTIFHLGLDSISAIKVCSLLRKSFIRLGVGELLGASSIRNIASLIDISPSDTEYLKSDGLDLLKKVLEHINIQDVLASAGIDKQSVERVVPATPGQVYLLSTWQSTKGAVFHSTFRYNSQVLLDRDRLDRAWQSLLAQIPFLRSTLVATNRRSMPIVQVVLKDCKPIIWAEKGSSLERIQGDAQTSLPTVTLEAQHGQQGTLLQLRILHAYYDAVSLPLLISHLQSLYHRPQASIVQRPTFEDFIVLTLLHSDESKREQFWKDYLRSPGSMMVGYINESTKRSPGVRIEVFQPALLPTISALGRAARLRGLSVHALFLAAYAKSFASPLLSYVNEAEKTNVVFGIYLGNRSHSVEGLPRLAAPTLNVVPLRVKIGQPSSLAEIAERIQHDLQVISSLQNSAVSLWEIDDWTGIKINSFVNFLKLPDSDEFMNETGILKEEQVLFHPAESDLKTARRQTFISSQTDEFVDPVAVRHNLVRDSYLPSIDVEASITEDGALDIGIFGPQDLVNLEEAEGILEMIKKELSDVGPSLAS